MNVNNSGESSKEILNLIHLIDVKGVLLVGCSNLLLDCFLDVIASLEFGYQSKSGITINPIFVAWKKI